MIPPYVESNITEPVTVDVTVKCGGKESDAMSLTYMPLPRGGHSSRISSKSAVNGNPPPNPFGSSMSTVTNNGGSIADQSPALRAALVKTETNGSASPAPTGNVNSPTTQRITILEQLDNRSAGGSGSGRKQRASKRRSLPRYT